MGGHLAYTKLFTEVDLGSAEVKCTYTFISVIGTMKAHKASSWFDSLGRGKSTIISELETHQFP